jgi:hypothetical protein
MTQNLRNLIAAPWFRSRQSRRTRPKERELHVGSCESEAETRQLALPDKVPYFNAYAASQAPARAAHVVGVLEAGPEDKPGRGKRKWTAAMRKAQGDRLRARWASGAFDAKVKPEKRRGKKTTHKWTAEQRARLSAPMKKAAAARGLNVREPKPTDPEELRRWKNRQQKRKERAAKKTATS